MLPLIKIGTFYLYTYPFIIGIALAKSLTFIIDRNRSDRNLKFFLMFVVVMSFFGAKLFYILSTLDKHQGIHQDVSFWLGGGYVFYGGLVLGFLTLCFFKRQNRISQKVLDDIVLGLILGHSIGRVGCFFAGCCHGVDSYGFQIPVQLIESSFLVILFYKLKKKQNILLYYLTSYSIFRFCIEFFRGDDIRGVFHGLSTSQWVSLIIFIALIYYRVTVNISSKR